MSEPARAPSPEPVVPSLERLTAGPFTDQRQIEALLRAFESCALPHAAWNHRAHLTVALWYTRRLAPAEALATVRVAIQRYNQAHNVPVTPTGGYHETLTRFYIHIVRVYAEATPEPLDGAADANRLFEAWGKKELPYDYYTREHLFSAEGRFGWVEPDVRPLPALPNQGP